ncbi:hypothetical protein HQ305_01885 [Rhodococcus sp. BP-149]|uniref:hypothetical protein n=1 Tax=unclassified Rhodococcus (in: high G+C Gram-positive bacteria) TaxID=192944 RepID=UPI001C9B62AA|nr:MULTISPECIES: hypothetical protein [unclassified Rhodococcus (in: high G+C Gram-positive bacteria)]MBY6684830.1 hypothetical protein [Rhodococcus sp. BP-288]MBY6692686.1 hypothetical protein [Rhodococcus sp. BP-188]MBY6698584.1 hypothetical protein [Rhodococcus sp. BP-285]MBY6701263.1 hypothetical protein [Rhodococcus sp. BP-283]MBY6712264.1 hypothetical protein [Rhodococcus sp. BP-160]
MKRTTVFFDRLGVLIIGLALVAVGGGAALWQRDRLPFELTEVDASVVTDAQDQQWWPWALLGAGVLIALLVVFSLVRRLPSSAGRTLSLPVTGDPDGRVTVDLRSVAHRAADTAREVDGVKSARARLRHERSDGRRVPVITVVVRAEESASLRIVAEKLTDVRSAVASVVGDGAVGVRVLLSA